MVEETKKKGKRPTLGKATERIAAPGNQVVLRAYKMRLDPDKRHLPRLHAAVSDARVVYNWAVRHITHVFPFSRYKREYLEAKRVEEDLPPFKEMKSEVRSKFMKEHNDAAIAHASECQEQFRGRVAHLLKEVCGWKDEDIKTALSKSAADVMKYHTKHRDRFMPWWKDADFRLGAPGIQKEITHACVAYADFRAGRHGYPKLKKKGEGKSFTIKDGKQVRPSKHHSRRLILAEGIARAITTKNGIDRDGLHEGIRVQNPKRYRQLKTAVKNGGEIRSATISEKAGYWYVSVLVREEIPLVVTPTPTQDRNGDVGIDLGVKIIAALSDGTIIDNPQFFRSSQKRRTALSRSVSRKEITQKDKNRKSRRHLRASLKRDRFEHKVALRRRTFSNLITKQLAERYRNVCIEDLNVKGMLKSPAAKPDPKNPGAFLPNGSKAKSGLAKSIQDVGFYEFKRQLIYKKGWYASPDHAKTIIISRWEATSQTCSQCGVRKTEKEDKLKLDVRVFECNACGFTEDRDMNAARNIKNAGLKLLQEEV